VADSITRILVVDDYEPWRRFVSSILQKHPKLQVIGEATDGLEGVEKAQSLQPDLILLDIGLPRLSGIEAARRIRKQAPKSLILFVSALPSPEVVEAALSVGQCGYVLKSRIARELLPAVGAILAGEWFVSPALADHDLSNRRTLENARRRHRVDFYPGDSAFVTGFASYIEAALAKGNVMVAIASDSHHSDIREKLKASGVNVDTAGNQKFYIPLELRDSLTLSDVSEEEMTGKGYHAVEAVLAAVKRGIRVTVG
jgi:DNA-binding NarL/FixJ family response regulator